MKLKVSRTLETLNLTSQFKIKKTALYFVLIFGIALTAVPSLFAKPKSSKNFKADLLVFKVEDNVYSALETLGILDQMDYYSCILFNDGIFDKRMHFKDYKKKELKILIDKLIKSRGKDFSKKLRAYFDESVTIIKLKKYIESQNYILDKNLKKLILKTDKMNNCGSKGYKKEKFSLWFEDLIKLEMYFKSRFKDAAFVVSESEILEFQKKNKKKLTKEQAKELIAKRKKNKSIDTFIKSVSKQISHENFW